MNRRWRVAIGQDKTLFRHSDRVAIRHRFHCHTTSLKINRMAPTKMNSRGKR
jgi:hypothetical protein